MFLYYDKLSECYDTDNKKDLLVMMNAADLFGEPFFKWWSKRDNLTPIAMHDKMLDAVVQNDFDKLSLLQEQFTNYVISNPEKYGFIVLEEGADY